MVISKKTRLKMSKSHKGRKHTEESKKKISNSKLGHKVSKQTREKLRKSMLKQFKNGRIKKGGSLKGSKNPAWKGGRCKLTHGYIIVHSPTHPYNMNGYILEHRLVMEKHLGRILLPKEVVHHINGIKDDNRIENLMLFNSLGDHVRHHYKIRRNKNGKQQIN